MEFSTMIFYPLEIVEQINYLSQISRITGQGKAIRKTNSPYVGEEYIIAKVEDITPKSKQLEFSIKTVKDFIEEQKAYTKETGKVKVYGDEEKLGFFLGQEVFEYGGK